LLPPAEAGARGKQPAAEPGAGRSHASQARPDDLRGAGHPRVPECPPVLQQDHRGRGDVEAHEDEEGRHDARDGVFLQEASEGGGGNTHT